MTGLINPSLAHIHTFIGLIYLSMAHIHTLIRLMTGQLCSSIEIDWCFFNQLAFLFAGQGNQRLQLVVLSSGSHSYATFTPLNCHLKPLAAAAVRSHSYLETCPNNVPKCNLVHANNNCYRVQRKSWLTRYLKLSRIIKQVFRRLKNLFYC